MMREGKACLVITSHGWPRAKAAGSDIFWGEACRAKTSLPAASSVALLLYKARVEHTSERASNSRPVPRQNSSASDTHKQAERTEYEKSRLFQAVEAWIQLEECADAPHFPKTESL